MNHPAYLCIGKRCGAQDRFEPSRAEFTVRRPHGFGTLRTLPEKDLPAYAMWCARNGGRDLLDAFELAAINARAVRLKPDVVSSFIDGDVEWTAKEMTHGPERIRWSPRVKCEACDGTGENSDDDFVAEEDWPECSECWGDGYFYGSDVTTDYDGNVVADQA